MRLREALPIDGEGRESCTNEKLREDNENSFPNFPSVVDAVSGYGVKVHSVLSLKVVQMIQTILNDTCPNIEFSKKEPLSRSTGNSFRS